MHTAVNNLPKVVTQRCPEQDLNRRPTDRKSNSIPVAPPSHLPMFIILCLALIARVLRHVIITQSPTFLNRRFLFGYK